jgi:acetylornithine/N-succinyldiaminopimelate aminotransferase
MTKYNELIKQEKKYILQTYGRYPVALKKGDGVYVWDVNNKKYLDFVAGIATCNLGYNHKQINTIIQKSSNTLIHTSNLFYTEPQIKLAKKISFHTNKGKVFFCNSGAEANETAIKLARSYGNSMKKPRRKILTLKNSFHGRTLNTIFATGQTKYQKGFAPKVGHFTYLAPNDMSVLKKALNNEVAAIMIEFIQGEGGINQLEKQYIKNIYDLCQKKKILFMADEVQTGYGRTGKLFAFKHYGITPDVITLAKAMANGLPMGAMAVKNQYATNLGAGMHASTFGGGYMVSSVANKVIDIISQKAFLSKVQSTGKYFKQEMIKLQKKYSFIVDIKGIGLMLGFQLKQSGLPIVKELLNHGLIANCIQDKILRFLPPLTISKKHVDEAIKILDEVFKKIA